MTAALVGFAIVIVLETIVLIVRKWLHDEKLNRAFDSSQQAIGKVPCKCGEYYVPENDALRREGSTHRPTLCFPEREEIRNGKEN